MTHLTFNPAAPPKVGDQYRCHQFGTTHTVEIVQRGHSFLRDAQGWLYSEEGWHARTLERLKLHNDRVPGYLSQDGEEITCWRGHHLAKVTLLKPAKHSMIADTNYYTFRAVDAYGGHWYGKGSKGMAISLNPTKSRL